MSNCSHHSHKDCAGSCKVCHSGYCEDFTGSRFGVCHDCAVKILVVLFIIMIIASYTVWYGLL